MTEAEWLASSNYRSLELEIHQKATERKGRLFACACCRLCWHLMPIACRRRVEAVERFAGGELSSGEMRALFHGFHPHPIAFSFLPGGRQAAEAVGWLGWQWRWNDPPDGNTWHEATCASRSAAEALAKSITWHEARQAEGQLLRCIFGNPFRPITLDPNWRTTTALQLAQGMHDSGDFAGMPILADALQDAGCENTDILDHCRGPGPHVRGCWVVDLVLSKI